MCVFKISDVQIFFYKIHNFQTYMNLYIQFDKLKNIFFIKNITIWNNFFIGKLSLWIPHTQIEKVILYLNPGFNAGFKDFGYAKTNPA